MNQKVSNSLNFLDFILELKEKKGKLDLISSQFSGWKQIYQLLLAGSYRPLILLTNSEMSFRPCCLKCNSCLSSLKKFRETKEWIAPIKCNASKHELKSCGKCNPCRADHLHAEMKILQLFGSPLWKKLLVTSAFQNYVVLTVIYNYSTYFHLIFPPEFYELMLRVTIIE
jgi:hypothetical protein